MQLNVKYIKGFGELKKEYKKEISKLEYENQNLEQENRSFIYILNELFQLLEKFFKKLLL